MNDITPAAPPFPATLNDWEYILTRSLLGTDGSVSDPIRSFEITPETLAQLCGLGPEHAHGAEDAFRRALKADPYLLWALQNGTARRPTPEVPHCMAILALSLLVDSLLDGAYEGRGPYREKLAQWLGIDRSFMNLSGISTMWVELVAWLNERIAAGDHFRPLILPEVPKSWTHIGYTRYLSFPTRRDVTLLRKLFEKRAEAIEDVSTLVLLLDQLLRSSFVSCGMQAAFQDFRRALRAGVASVDHRFWQLVMRARTLSGHAVSPAVRLHMEFDEDGGRHFRVTVVGSHDQLRPANLGSVAGIHQVQASPNLGPGFRRGVIFFRSIGLANWSASVERPVGIGPFHVAVADRHLRLAAGIVSTFTQTGNWHVTDQPVTADTLNDMMKQLELLTSMVTVRTITLSDGVHIGRSWLGQPRYLPVIEGSQSQVDITRIDGGTTALTCVNGALMADVPVEGEVTISDKAGRWSRRASFVTVAEVHAQLDGAAYKQPKQEEWKAELIGTARRAIAELGWDESSYNHQDMLEAVYGNARSGVTEGDLVGLVARSANSQTWDMVRTLQESTFVDARMRERWRGRIFTLGRPKLTEIEIGGEPSVLVSGAIPSRLEEEFRKTAVLHGGRPFRRLSAASSAPPLLGAAAVSAVTLATALGWRIEPPPFLPNGTPTNRLIETSVLGESYIVASEWDWAIGRFRVGKVAAGPVSLVRLVHPGGRDHDIYRVTGTRRRSFNSRHAAIFDAHRQAGKPLFEFREDRLVRISAEGALPLEIAKALRLRSLVNGGASDDGWAYVTTRRDRKWLDDLLPGIIEGRSPPAADPAMSYRRGRGARRPSWNQGNITT